MADTFGCGHPKTPENTRSMGAYTRCRECANERERMRKDRRKAGIGPVDVSAFKCGHLKTPDNTIGGNRPRCAICRRASRKAYYRNKILGEKPKPQPTSHDRLLAALWREHPAILERLSFAKGAVVVRP